MRDDSSTRNRITCSDDDDGDAEFAQFPDHAHHVIDLPGIEAADGLVHRSSFGSVASAPGEHQQLAIGTGRPR